jgi:hypothetical protein
MTIEQSELFCIKAMPIHGIAASMDSRDFEDGFCGSDHLLRSGWKVLSDSFFQSLDGSGFEGFYAHKEGYEPVFGSYADGIYSKSEEALQNFYENHPPFWTV